MNWTNDAVRARIGELDGIFAGLPDTSMDLILNNSRVISVDSEQTILYQNDKATDIYYILEGVLMVSSSASSGRHNVVKLLKESDLIGA